MAKKSKVADMPMPSMNSDYQAEDDARTLQRAGEVMSDPERMKKAHKHHKKQKKAMRSVDDLIKYRNEVHGTMGDHEPDMSDTNEASEGE